MQALGKKEAELAGAAVGGKPCRKAKTAPGVNSSHHPPS